MRPQHPSSARLLVFLLLVAGLATPARGQDIEVTYEGVGVPAGMPAPWDGVGTAESWSVDFCFDPTVEDTDPSDDVGVYPGAITSAIVTIGDVVTAADLDGENQVRVANDQEGAFSLFTDIVGFTFELTNGTVVTVGFAAVDSVPPSAIEDDGLPDCLELSNLSLPVMSLNVPAPEPLVFIFFDGEEPECGACEPPECFLVIGDAPGATGTFTVLGHTFETQVGPVGSWWPVWLDEGPEFVIGKAPSVRSAVPHVGLEPFEGGTLPQVFYAQVLMWNPQSFPGNPEQFSHGLAVTVMPDGRVVTVPYGSSDGGLEIWAETDWNDQGQRILRLPFSIPGF